MNTENEHTYDQHSSNTSKLSPKSATINYANDLLYDQIALLDEACSQQEEVLYAQIVRGSFEQETVPYQGA
jgi:hypothetical protein